MKSSFLWLTDTHLDRVMPWNIAKFMLHLQRDKPNGLFLTGDIADGDKTCYYLEYLAKHIGSCPIYFVLGNHDYFHSSIEKQHQRIRELCKRYPHLIWITEAGVVHLNDEVCIIGTEGWFDAEQGKPEYLQFTLDWLLIEDFQKLPSMEDRITAWRKLADQSADDITDKLEKAIERKYKNIYILTHIPCWKEATRDVGTMLEKFWLPYNTNLRLGRAIEKVMGEHKKKSVVVLTGHTHCPEFIRVSRNITCQVGKNGIKVHNSQKIYL